MKNTLLASILSLLLFSACKKDQTENQSELTEKKFKVSVAISADPGTSQVSESPSLKDQIVQLTIIAYRNGVEYTRKTQFNTDPYFGKFDLELPNDHFQFVTIGSKATFGINQFYQGNSTNPVLLPFTKAYFEYWQPTPYMGEKEYKTNDTFFSSILNTIPSNSTINIVLKRIVGKLDINIADVDTYDLDIYSEDNGYKFADEVSFGASTHQYFYRQKGPLSLYIIKTRAPLTLEISGGGKVKILQVPVFKNQHTIVSGKLLAPTTVSGILVKIDDCWSTDSTKVEF